MRGGVQHPVTAAAAASFTAVDDAVSGRRQRCVSDMAGVF